MWRLAWRGGQRERGIGKYLECLWGSSYSVAGLQCLLEKGRGEDNIKGPARIQEGESGRSNLDVELGNMIFRFRRLGLWTQISKTKTMVTQTVVKTLMWAFINSTE